MSRKNKHRGPMHSRPQATLAKPNARPQSAPPPHDAQRARSICQGVEAASRWTAIQERLVEANCKTPIAFHRAGQVTPVRFEWLADGRLPQGALSVVAGESGTCKSLLATEWAARVSQGTGEADAALLALGIDLPAPVVRVRLDAAGADADRVALASLGWPEGGEDQSFAQLERRIAALEAGMESGRTCKLLVVDNFEAWAGGVDASPCRARKNYFLLKLAELALRTKAAVVVLARLGGPAGGRVATRELAELSAIAPVVWLAAGDADDAQRRLLLPVKNSLGPKLPGAAFRIKEGRVAWEAAPIDAADWAPTPPSAQRASDLHDREWAAEWLLEALSDGPVESTELFRQARGCGISAQTLRRAGKALGLKPGKAAFEGPWLWKLEETIAGGSHQRGAQNGQAGGSECGAQQPECGAAATKAPKLERESSQLACYSQGTNGAFASRSALASGFRGATDCLRQEPGANAPRPMQAADHGGGAASPAAGATKMSK